MNQIKSIFANTSWLTISQTITSFCAFLWTIIIARYLGVSDYGVVSFAISFTALSVIFMDLGMSTYATREISKHKDLLHKYVNNIFYFKIILAIILFFISLFILYLMNYPTTTILVTMIFTVEISIMSMTVFLNGVFQAFEKVKYQAIGGILNSGLLLVFILITIGFDFGVISIAIAYTIAYAFYFAYMLFNYVRRFGFPKFELDSEFIKSSLVNSLPFGLTNFFYTIYFSIDIVMLSYLTGDFATGLYKSAYNIITVFTTFFVVYQSVVFPVMSKFFEESQDLIKVSYELSIKYLLMIIIPISVGVYFYASPIVDIIYSHQYSLSYTTVQILIWTVSFLFINGAGSILLNAIDKERTVTKIYILAAIFNVCLNLIMIPMLSYEGAAIATVLSEIFITVLILHPILKTSYKPDYRILINIGKLVICGIILLIAFNLINTSIWLAIPIGLVIYIISLLLTRSIDNQDRIIIKEILSKQT
ncbi:flippase [Methanobrevibacter sp.]|uniref:flippase n=1 Tax=Methanobrevibacter sp. TaxID=66852 RepID=UPI0025FAC291|nr:flippase [Methanobrevibacter sp.]MBQ2961453.1 flippase [Methanobrevibacter sp.]